MSEREILVRDVPVGLWVFGLIFFGAGILIPSLIGAPIYVGAIFALIGLVILLLVPAVYVEIDQGRRVLVIRKIGVLQRSEQEIPVHKIASVYVDQRVSNDDDGTSYTYRVVIGLDDGTEVPLRKSSSSGRKKKVVWADAIREAVGVGGQDESPISLGEAVAMAFTLDPVDGQEESTGISAGEQETDGVRWQLETLRWAASDQNSLIYRWQSDSYKTPDYFTYLAQRMEGVGEQKLLMNLAGKALFKQSLRMFGFDHTHTPGLERAELVTEADQRLLDNYLIYSSSPNQVRGLLNPWAVMPLVRWADRYKLERGKGEVNQLTVLISPMGVFVSALDELDAAEVDELVGLGVELVRSLGG